MAKVVVGGASTAPQIVLAGLADELALSVRGYRNISR